MDHEIKRKNETIVGQVLTPHDYVDLLKQYSAAYQNYKNDITPITASELLNIKLAILENFPFSTQAMVIKMWPGALEVLRRESNQRIED